ncbi:MAG: class I SAM-dependent RNA methyltransferase, partial [Sphingomonadales bacterium]|nr:class I SAM-dependent RNA methyltransferase [Sphingomonadales bacterium]
MSESLSPVVRIAARGDGVTEDGRHAPLSAPGDLLSASGALRRGPHHREPPCRHFPVCGGCQLQQLDDESYATFVHDRVAGAIAGQGLDAPVRSPIVSPPKSRRRATLHAERRGRQVLLGFTEGSSHRLIDLAECHVLLPELFAMLAPLRGLLAVVLTERGRVDVHLTRVDQGVDVLIGGTLAEGLSAVEGITRFA